MYPRVRKLIFDEWQKIWNCCTGNKLRTIKPTVGGYKQKTRLSRCDSVLLNRLRIGHTRLMHFYLLSVDDIPECGTCQFPLTVKHILIEYVDYNDVRNKHFVASLSRTYLITSMHTASLILSKEFVFISNFNVYILVFVIYFLF